MASTSCDGAGGVCCMCGDRGLLRELFRCKLCRVRLQHRYCSELYPRATAHRRCNWCLRGPADGGGHAQTAAVAKTAERRKATASTSDEERQRLDQASAGCSASRRADVGLQGRPVKKQKTDERAAAPVVAAAKAGVKVKARKYKLLTEVISC